MVKWPVLCLVVLGAVDLAREVTALKINDFGVCMTKIISRTTKRITYTKYSNKWCGKRKCIVRVGRIQPVAETRDQPACCSGFQYRAEADDCAPLCSIGCSGGRCVAPNTCQCDPPSYLDPDHNNTCIHPVCDPPCLNADCIANNTCKCHTNFEAFNSTHCYKCDPGYSINANFTCAPKCEPACVNGECTAPNTCSCAPGYASKGNKCEPVCHCVNAICVENTCACLDGYSAVNSTHCAPKCDHCNGSCVAPNMCECLNGYVQVDGSCRPVCNLTCDNGYCSGPDECTCNEGFVKNETSVCVKSDTHIKGQLKGPGEGICERSIDDVKTFKVTGPCSKAKNKKCSHIERRKVTNTFYICCDGWTFVDGICVPLKCAPPCRNARCTDTNVCTCEAGLVHLNDTLCGPTCPPDQFNDLTEPAFPCKSKCTQPCTNGVCVDFDTCSCNPGYKLKDQFNCEPKCSTCDHGTCGAPDYECNCSPGYTKNDEGKCEPVCDNCEHGSCIAPNDCECDGGYRKENSTCIPVCDEICQNGHCTAPNDCTCDPHYSKDATNKFKCNPICNHACVNSTCVAPDICQCNDGFESTGNNWKCRPSCKSCNNGKCVAPNKCQCNEGYEKNDEDTCVPICKSCDNGVCVAPDKCECKDGYKKNDTDICVPVCKSCDNGACVAPNKCVCNDGYQKNDKDTCIPVCKTPCIDGVCAKPDTCVCNVGYKMNEISKICKPECHPICINSTCVAVDECKCFYGYMKTNVSNVCKPACNSCFNGDCVDPEVCQCHDGYELVNGTCLPAPSMNCLDCDGVCKDGVCACSNGTLCHQIESADVELTPTLAGLQLTWMLGGAVGLLLVIVVAVVLMRMWRHRRSYDQKTPDNNYEAYGSVAYTINNTLMHREPQDPVYDDVELDRQTDVGLLEHIPTEDYVERI